LGANPGAHAIRETEETNATVRRCGHCGRDDGSRRERAFAGEITGNGKLKTVNGSSPCAFSGQEDLQWYTADGDATL
jgi:hypothetical protein